MTTSSTWRAPSSVSAASMGLRRPSSGCGVREEALRLGLVVPEHFRERDHAREALGALALDELQAVAALVRRGRHDAVHELEAGRALDAGAFDDALEAVLRQAGLDGLGDVGDRTDVGAQAQDPGDAVGRDGHGIVTSCDHYRLK